MITLFALALIAAGIIYLIFFGIFKLIWMLLKSKRNFWPLVLAAVGTFLFCACIGIGAWWGVKKLIAPFNQMITRAKANPEVVLGERTYKDDRFPFELTVFDGMDFSEWISFDRSHVKIGVDTNIFKTKAPTDNSFFSIVLARTPIQNKEDPFAQWKNLKNEPNTQNNLRIVNEEETTVNGLPAYRVDAVAYSNRGALDIWGVIIAADSETLYYVIVTELGNEEKKEQVETILRSFRTPAATQPATAPEPLTLALPSIE